MLQMEPCSALLFTDDDPHRYLDPLPHLPPEITFRVCRTEDEAVANATEATVLVHRGHVYPSRLMAAASKLRWVHNLGAGVEHWLCSDFTRRGITLTNSRGCNAPPIGEYVAAVILGFGRGLHRVARAQFEKRWQPQFGRAFEVTEMTVGLVGYGSVAREVAWRAEALGLKVVATRRNLNAGNGSFFSFAEVLSLADFLVVAVPLTRETRHLLGSEAFARMKPGSYLINVSRGSTVDEQALVEALHSGHLAGAALDVFETEPLPLESPLWEMPNVIVTPHTAAASPRLYARKAALLAENLRRFLDGRELVNLVEVSREY